MKSYKKYLGFDDKWLVIIGTPVVAISLSSMMFADILVNDFWLYCKSCLSVSLLHTVIYWILFRELCVFFRKTYPSTKDSGKRIFQQVVALVVLYFIVKALLDPCLDTIFHSEMLLDQPRHKLGMSIASLTVIFMVLGIYETIGFYSRLQNSLVEKEELKRINIQSQLEGLKNQVNPHFLFNSLNTLSYLIPESPEKAVYFVQKLSKVYRYILEIRDKKLISLEEELKFLHSYTFLLKERFGQNLAIDIDISDEHLQDHIVPLSLQILLENAIKHNIISTQKPLYIQIFIEGKDKLIVKNNLQKKNQMMNSTKVGLQNIKNRYRFFSSKEVDIIVTPDSFMVVLPLINSPVLMEDQLVLK